MTGWFGSAVVLMYGVWVEVCGSLWRLLSIFCSTGVFYWGAGIQAEEVVAGSCLFPSCLLTFFVCLFIFSYSDEYFNHLFVYCI